MSPYSSKSIPSVASRKASSSASSSSSSSSSSAFRLAILAIAIGRYELGSHSVAVDAFGTPPNYSYSLLPTRKRTRRDNICRLSLFLESQSSKAAIISSSSNTRSPFALRAKDDSSDDDNNVVQRFFDSATQRLQQAFLPSLSVVWWPLFAAMGIPALVNVARSFPPNSSEQFAVVTVLIVANRIYLYALALTIVATAACRGASGDPKELGQRLTVLTEELLVLDKPLPTAIAADSDSPSFPERDTASDSSTSTTAPTPVAPSFVKKMVGDSGLEENLDGVDAGTQALAIPALVAGLLAISVVSLPIWSEGFLPTPNEASIDAEWVLRLQAAVSKILPFLSQVWNAILLTLFARAEFRRLGSELLGTGIGTDSAMSEESSEESSVPKTQIIAECLLAVTVTGYGAYYLQYWPAQNFVNSAIAILVARAIRLDSFNAVVSALALLALYDGASVLLIPGAANAVVDAAVSAGASGTTNIVDGSSMALAASSNPASSAMGSVAMQKLTSGGFQPGLLVTKLDGDKLTGTLGLGDAVFPSILASFLKRFDEDCNSNSNSRLENDTKSRLFEASLGGYAAGCAACELVPAIATRGVPALVFIVPFMGLATLLAAVQAGSFEELRLYNNETKE